MVKPGDSIPDITLFEGAPDGKVDLAKEIASGDALIIGVPAAFSMSQNRVFRSQLTIG